MNTLKPSNTTNNIKSKRSLSGYNSYVQLRSEVLKHFNDCYEEWFDSWFQEIDEVSSTYWKILTIQWGKRDDILEGTPVLHYKIALFNNEEDYDNSVISQKEEVTLPIVKNNCEMLNDIWLEVSKKLQKLRPKRKLTPRERFSHLSDHDFVQLCKKRRWVAQAKITRNESILDGTARRNGLKIIVRDSCIYKDRLKAAQTNYKVWNDLIKEYE